MTADVPEGAAEIAHGLVTTRRSAEPGPLPDGAAGHGMTLRTAEPADLAAVLELAVDFYAEDGFATPRDRLAEHLRHLLASDAAHVAVSTVGGPVVAFAISTSGYGLENGLIAELEDLYVAPAFRRRGLAAGLIEDSARWAAGIGATQLEIVVAPNGQDVSQLFRYYRAHGFTDEGRRLLARPLS
jgi:ribosomal protein S18 acetylase RimI-like enzyme